MNKLIRTLLLSLVLATGALSASAPQASADVTVGVKTLLKLECTGYLDRYADPDYKITFALNGARKPYATVWVRNGRSEDLSYRRVILGEVKIKGNENDIYVGNDRFRLYVRNYRRSDLQDNGEFRDYQRKFQTKFDCLLKDGQ